MDKAREEQYLKALQSRHDKILENFRLANKFIEEFKKIRSQLLAEIEIEDARKRFKV